MSRKGRERKFKPKRSSQLRGAEGLARGLRPLCLVQLTFTPPAVAGPNDRLVALSVSSQSDRHRPQPLHSCHWRAQLEQQQRVDACRLLCRAQRPVADSSLTFKPRR